ncbi:MAG: SAM-dependent chlorinase/fluorinase [Myxococcota bacterium]
MNVTLLSDFGTRDGYVAALKGSLLRRAPDARLIDVTHEIAPGEIASGAFVLAQAAPHFPPGTVHLAVVDPGVGSDRRAIACEIDGQRFVAPDNGLLSRVLDGAQAIRAHEITKSELWNEPVSPVFHGRDIFAPVAGHLAAGGELEDVGGTIEPSSLVRLPESEVRREDGAAVGQVVHVDRFGNLITNLKVDADGVEGVRVETAGRTVALRHTYADVPEGEIVALVGSSGRLEIACNGDSAARVLGASSGSVVVLRPRGRS